MNQYLIDKLKEGRLNKGLKQSDVTKLTGIKNTTLSNYENGNTEPDMDTFLKLCHLYELDYAEILGEAYDYRLPGFSIDIKKSDITILEKYHALDPTGRAHVDAVLQWESEHKVQLHQAVSSAPVDTLSVRIIQYYQRPASAGNGQIVFDGVPVKPLEIPDVPEYRRVSYAVGVNGQSMEPLYEDGDILLVEPTCQIEQGEVGIFIVGDKAYVKELGKTELISKNKEHKNIPLTEDTKCMGRVVDKL